MEEAAVLLCDRVIMKYSFLLVVKLLIVILASLG
jgi:hypothetical protein